MFSLFFSENFTSASFVLVSQSTKGNQPKLKASMCFKFAFVFQLFIPVVLFPCIFSVLFLVCRFFLRFISRFAYFSFEKFDSANFVFAVEQGNASISHPPKVHML